MDDRTPGKVMPEIRTSGRDMKEDRVRKEITGHPERWPAAMLWLKGRQSYALSHSCAACMTAQPALFSRPT